MGYGSMSNMLAKQTALDAFIAPIPGRNPSDGCRRANRLSCRFVSLVFFALTDACSLCPSLGATLQAAIAVQIVRPDDLSLNHSYGYAFGRGRPSAQKIRGEEIGEFINANLNHYQSWLADQAVRTWRVD